MENCPHCDARLKPAARFCLACDRPLDETSRLSVGEPVQVAVGRPLVGVAAVAGTLLVLGGVGWGGLAFIHHERTRSRDAVIADVEHGTAFLVDAEAGHASACQRSTAVLAGPAEDVARECRAIVGEDPGAAVTSIRVDRLELEGRTGTARIRATIRDGSGSHTVDRRVDLVHQGRAWRMSWDGRSQI